MESSLRVLLRFVYPPNRLGLCGKRDPGVYSLLKKEKWEKKEKEKVKDFLKNFKVLHAYLTALSSAFKCEIFDWKAVKAYLIGYEWRDYEIRENLKKELIGISLPNQLEKVERIPLAPYTHNFHVLYFGPLTVSVKSWERLRKLCRVSLLEIVDEKLARTERGEIVEYSSPFMEVEKGDFVFAHYRVPFKHAEEEEIEIFKECNSVIGSS